MTKGIPIQPVVIDDQFRDGRVGLSSKLAFVEVSVLLTQPKDPDPAPWSGPFVLRVWSPFALSPLIGPSDSRKPRLSCSGRAAWS